MFCWSKAQKFSHVYVATQPFYSDTLLGSATIVCQNKDNDNTRHIWKTLQNEIVGTGNTCSNLHAGNYVVTTRTSKETIDTHFTISNSTLPIVLGYTTRNSSHETAWDGSIVANVSNVGMHTFLWSNGEITITPELNNVSAGCYSVCILDEANRIVNFVHASGPAWIKPFLSE